MTTTIATIKNPLEREIARVARDVTELARSERALLSGDNTTARSARHHLSRWSDALRSSMGVDDFQTDALIADLLVLGDYEERVRGARFVSDVAISAVREAVRLSRR